MAGLIGCRPLSGGHQVFQASAALMQTYPSDASAPLPVTLSMATCRSTYHGHREGWGPVSTLREFDLTPCFEEGIILSTLLVILLVASLFRLWGVKSRTANHTLTARSVSVLKAKLVCSVATLLVLIASTFF